MSGNALIVYGGWEGHQPRETSEYWAAALEKEGFSVRLENSLDAFADRDLLLAQDLIIPNWTMGTLSEEQVGGLDAATEAGIGIAGFHGGMGDAFRGNIHYHFITGVQFLSHPGNIKKWEIEIPDSCHDPIVGGLDTFEIESEQYYIMVDPNFEWLAETTFRSEEEPWLNGRKMPVSMKKIHKNSRIYYCSLGHQVHEFDMPEVHRLIKRGFLWASRKGS